MTRDGSRMQLWVSAIIGLVAVANVLMGEYFLAAAQFLIMGLAGFYGIAQDRWSRRGADWPWPARIVHTLVILTALLLVILHFTYG